MQVSIEEIKLFHDPTYATIMVALALNNDERNILANTLLLFLSIFTKAPGLCTAFEHFIDTGNHKPISTTLRPMPPGKKKDF